MAIAVKQKTRHRGAAHKRRYGEHQQHTKSFLSTYHPYLPLFVLAFVILVVLGGLALGPTGAMVGGIGGAIGIAAIVL